MPDIYNANLTRTPRFGAYLNQYAATSGRVPSTRVLDQIIQSELDNAANQMWRNKQLQLQQQQLSEQSRQFNVGQETQEKARKSGEIQGLLGLGTNLYTTKLGLDYLRGGGATQGGTAAAPTVAGPTLWGKTKDLFGWGGATAPTATTPAVTGAAPTWGADQGGFADTAMGPTAQASGMSGWDYAIPGLAGFAAGRVVGHSGTGQDVGRFLMGQRGGESERGAVSGGLAGAATGYLTSGGDLWGTLLGAATGATGGSNIIDKIFG